MSRFLPAWVRYRFFRLPVLPISWYWLFSRPLLTGSCHWPTSNSISSTGMTVVGEAVGANVGLAVGLKVGLPVGLKVGLLVGARVGAIVVGLCVGKPVGAIEVGIEVGERVGLAVGFWVGSVVGDPRSEVTVSFSQRGSSGWVSTGGELVHIMAQPSVDGDWSRSRSLIATESQLSALGIEDTRECGKSRIPVHRRDHGACW